MPMTVQSRQYEHHRRSCCRNSVSSLHLIYDVHLSISEHHRHHPERHRRARTSRIVFRVGRAFPSQADTQPLSRTAQSLLSDRTPLCLSFYFIHFPFALTQCIAEKIDCFGKPAHTAIINDVTQNTLCCEITLSRPVELAAFKSRTDCRALRREVALSVDDGSPLRFVLIYSGEQHAPSCRSNIDRTNSALRANPSPFDFPRCRTANIAHFRLSAMADDHEGLLIPTIGQSAKDNWDQSKKDSSSIWKT